MATIEEPSASEHFIPTRVLRSNARFYASDQVTALLGDVVEVPDFTLVIDVDALERTTRARIERVMVAGLEALARNGVRVVILARDKVERATLLQRCISGARLLGGIDSYEQVHAEVTGPLVGVSDDLALLRTLRPGDRGIALGAHLDIAGPNVTTADDASLRASLWWLVDARSNAGARPCP